MQIRKIQEAQGLTKYPAANLVKKDPKTAAIISKNVAANNGAVHRDDKGNRITNIPEAYAFRQMLQNRAKRNTDSSTILKLLPDIELSIQILVSSILSPSDMTKVELNFSGPKNLTTSELMGSLLNRTKQHFDEVYKINPILPKILRDLLALKGSYPIAVIPENSIDAFINGDQRISTESLRAYVDDKGSPRSIGILGDYKEKEIKTEIGISLERFNVNVPKEIDNKVHYRQANKTDPSSANDYTYTKEEYLFVTDNPSTLKLSKINERLRREAVKEKFDKGNNNLSLEAFKEISDLKIENLIYRDRIFRTEPVATLKTQTELTRKSVGNPLVIKFPSESIIPVHIPGDVEKHIGYFVVLDETGNPIEAPDDEHFYSGMNQGFGSGNGQNSLSSSIIKKVETNLGSGAGSFNPNNIGHLDVSARVYAEMVEKDLISRIKNGVHSSNVSISKNEQVYRIMLSRVLAKKHTQILFLPIEYVTYFAFSYTSEGIGKTLLDDNSQINTLRTIMLFTDVIASIKNSIGRTKVLMAVPESDPNPMKTIEVAQDEIVRSRQLSIPLGVTNASDITDYIQRAGFEWEFTGHKGLPELKFDFQNLTSSFTRPDSDLQDNLKKSSIQGMGLSPENIDNGFSAEFATTITNNNLLMGKRILNYQEIFNPLIADHLRKYAMNSEELVNDLKEIITNGFDGIKIELDEDLNKHIETLDPEVKKKILVNKVLTDYLNLFEVTLPKPPTVSLVNQLDDLKTYTEGLDLVLDAYISDTFMTTATSGELSNEINTIKAMVKAYFIRKYLISSGLYTELSELTATKEDGQPQLDLMKEVTEHVQALIKSGVTSLVKLQPMVEAGNKDLQASGTEPSNTPSSDTGSDSGGDDELGLGGDLDLGGDTTTTPEVPSSEDEGTDTETDKPKEDKGNTAESEEDK